MADVEPLDSGTQTAPSVRSSWFPAAALVPGIAAVFAGLLYAAGGMAISGEVLAAGYQVQDALPLTPLPQILARGALDSPGSDRNLGGRPNRLQHRDYRLDFDGPRPR